MVCERINKCKCGISQKDGHYYKFDYVQKENMPDNYKKTSYAGQKRHKLLTDEDKKKRQKMTLFTKNK